MMEESTIHSLDRARYSQIIEQWLPLARRPAHTYQLRYWLEPAVARRDVSAYFPNTEITYHDDGSATVTASVINLWQARQILLRYGAACQVREPPELVDMFRDTICAMATLYLYIND